MLIIVAIRASCFHRLCKVPNKLMEQGKSILDGNPGLFNSKFLGDPAFNERNDVVDEEAKDYPREQRPALGHKRARFLLKPNKT